MKLEEQNLMFFLRAPQYGGTEKVVLQLCEVFSLIVNKIVVASAGGFCTDHLCVPVKHYSIPDIEKKDPKTIIDVIRKIKRIVHDEGITIIHCHHRMAAFYVRATGLYKQCTFINTSHNVFMDRRALTRYALKKARLIACGNRVKNNLEKRYGLSEICVIHNAVRAFKSNTFPETELKEEKREGLFLIGNFGRLSKQKGMRYYIQAIPYVVAIHPKTKFYIIGAGEEENELKQMSVGLPIVFLGYKENVREIMNQLDLVVLSSLWEGLPLVPIEAFSVGKTIVATRVDGTDEIVKDGVNGILVNPRNPKVIAEKINWMIEHPEERRRMEENAFKTFEDGFSFDTFAEAYIDFYRSL